MGYSFFRRNAYEASAGETAVGQTGPCQRSCSVKGRGKQETGADGGFT